MNNKNKFCSVCGEMTIKKKEGDTTRDFCKSCNVFLYVNPLPIVSTILAKDRKIAIVKRKN
ncbi:MAG: NUDIX hydrolase, partial [Desulfobacteraceae bacterium]|nr:NUDIX hydrolase [Desulfobacteraceae bacterium]